MAEKVTVVSRRCPQCGTSLPPGPLAACPHCGADLKAVRPVEGSLPPGVKGREVLYERGIRRIITAGLLLAITLLLSFTRVGFIPVPTPAANATIVHIPAIIGGILEGSLVGLIVGLGFGFASFMNATIPMFKDPLVAVVPRLFIGVTAAWTFAALWRANKRILYTCLGVLMVLGILSGYELSKQEKFVWLGMNLGGFAVGLAVVVVVAIATALLYVWIRREDVRIVAMAVAAVVGSLTNTVLVLGAAVLRGYIPAGVAWMIGLSHGIPEAIISVIVVVAVVAALRQIGRGRRGARL